MQIANQGGTPPTTPTNPAPLVSTFKFNHEAVRAKVKSLRTYLQAYIGKPGYNSHLWVSKNLAPLEKRLDKGEETQALQEAVLALKEEAPICTPHNVANPPKEAQSAGGGSKDGQEKLNVANVEEGL